MTEEEMILALIRQARDGLPTGSKRAEGHLPKIRDRRDEVKALERELVGLQRWQRQAA